MSETPSEISAENKAFLREHYLDTCDPLRIAEREIASLRQQVERLTAQLAAEREAVRVLRAFVEKVASHSGGCDYMRHDHCIADLENKANEIIAAAAVKGQP